MKGPTNRFLTLLLVLTLALSCTLGVRNYRQKQAAQQALEAAQTMALSEAELPEEPAPLAVEPPAEEAPPQDPLEENARFLLETDLAALRETNEDVLGWIHIPDTAVDFPLMRSADNADYLNTTWDGRASVMGSIFLECRSAPDLTDFNTIIYGHNIRGGKMFGSLHFYRDEAYRNDHPFVYLVTDEGVHRYEIFAAYEAPVISDTFRIYFEDDARRSSALEHYTASSQWSAGWEPDTDDHILTLSTCTGTGRYENRWVVQAVRTGQFPPA